MSPHQEDIKAEFIPWNFNGGHPLIIRITAFHLPLITENSRDPQILKQEI